MASVHIDNRSGASYTVATNAQLLGGNLTTCCECSEERERERKILRRRTRFALRQTGFGYTHPCPAASPSRPSAVFCALTQEIINDDGLTTPTQQSFDAASMLCSASGSTEDRTPTQRSFDEASIAHSRSHAADIPKSGGHSRHFSVGTDTVDRLLRGLLHSPMLRRWKGDGRNANIDKPTKTSSPQGTRSELPLEDPGGAAATDSVLQTLRDCLDALRAPRTHLVRLALTTDTVAESARGNCKALGGLQDPSIGTSLHIIREGDSGRTIVRLQIVIQVLRSLTAKPIHCLLADFDITESFMKAAITDLLTTATSFDEQDHTDEADIWLQLAHESDYPRQDLNKLLDTTLTRFASLTPETCSMQTLTLLATLHRLERHLRDFYVLRTLEVHANGVPAKVDVPFISQHLHQSVSAREGEDLRDLMVSVLEKCGAGGEEFYHPLREDVDGMGLRFLPISDGFKGGKLVWTNLTTLFEAPHEVHGCSYSLLGKSQAETATNLIPDLTNLRTELLEEQANLRAMRKARKKVSRNSHSHSHTHHGSNDTVGIELDDVSLKTIGDTLRTLIKRFRDLERPFLEPGEPGINDSARTHKRKSSRRNRSRNTSSSPSPWQGHGAYYPEKPSRRRRSKSDVRKAIDDEVEEDAYWAQRCKYANFTLGRRLKWLTCKAKAQDLFATLSRVQIRRIALQVGGLAVWINQNGPGTLETRESIRRIDERVGRQGEGRTG